MESNKGIHKKELFWLFLIGSTIIFLTCFNLYKMDDFSTPDSEVEKIFAKAMWRENSLFPETWYSTTEPLNLRPTVFTAILWGILKDMQIAHSITLFIMMIASCFAVYYMFSGLKNINKISILIAVELLLAGFGLNFTRWYFAIYGAYGFILISMFLLAGYFLRIYQEQTIKTAERIFLFAVYFMLGLVGPRTMIFTLAPFTMVNLYCVILKYFKTSQFKKKIIIENAFIIGIYGLGLLGYVLIFLKSGKLAVDTVGATWIRVEDIWTHLFQAFLNCIKVIGIDGSVKLLSIDGMNILCKISMIIIFFLVIHGIKNLKEEQQYLFYLFLAAAGIAILFCSTLSLTGDGQPQNRYWYFYSVVYVIWISIVLSYEWLLEIKKCAGIFEAFLGCIMIINMFSTYINIWNVTGYIAEKNVAAYLIENQIPYAYAPYNSAYSIQEASGEKVEMVSLIVTFSMENADQVGIWYFNLDEYVVKEAQNQKEFIVIVTDYEEELMLGNGNSILYQKPCEKIQEIDHYNLYRFIQFPFQYIE